MSPPSTDPAPPRPRRRGRRWALALAALLGLVAACVLGLLTTAPGLELVREVAESTANDALRGTLRIGRIEGSALSELVVRDIAVEDRAGREAVRISRVRLRWRPAALLSQTIDVQTLELDGVRVLAVTSTAGGLNLAELGPAPGPPEPKAEAPLFPLDLPQLELHKLELFDVGFVLQDGDHEVTRVQDLGLEVRVSAGADRAALTLTRLDAKVLDGRALHAEADLGIEGHAAAVRKLAVALDGAAVTVDRSEATLPTGAARGHIELRLPAGLARAFGAPEAVRADVDLAVDVARADGPRWSSHIRGAVAGAPLTANATVTEDLSDVQADLHLARFDPQAAYREAPAGALDIDLRARGDVSTPTSPKLEAWMNVGGRVTPPGMPSVRISRLHARTHLDGDRAQAKVTGRVAGAALDVDAAVSRLFGSPRVDRGRVDIEVPDLQTVVGQRASGRLALTATTSGTLDNLRAEGQIDAANLAWRPMAKLGRLAARWTLRGLPMTPSGTVDLDARGAVLDGRPIDRVQVDLRAHQDDSRTLVDAETLRIRTGELVWRGGGAHLALDPGATLRVSKLGLASEAGKLRLDATLGLGARPKVNADLLLEALTLERLPRRLAPELGALEGRVDLVLAAQVDGGEVAAKVATSARAVRAAPDHPPADLDAQVVLRPGQMVATATVGLDGASAVTLHTTTKPPRVMTDPAAWSKALTRAPLAQARIDIRQLPLRVLQRFVGQEIFRAGTTEGRIDIDGDRRARIAIDVRDAKPLDVAVTSALRLRAGFDPDQVWAHGRLRGGPWGTGTFTATAAAPHRLFDVARWAKAEPAAVKAARLDVVGTELDVLDTLGVVPGLRGGLDADVEVKPGLSAVRARVRLHDLEHADVGGRVDVRADLGLDETLRQDLEARLDGRPVITTHFEGPISITQLIAGDLPTPDALQIRGEAKIDALPLRPFARLARLEERAVRGAVTASVSVAGRASQPEGQAWLSFDGLRLAKVGFSDVVARAHLERERLTAEARVEDEHGGALRLSAQLTEALGRVDARLVSEGLDLGFISRLGLLPVGLETKLFADVTAQGPVERPAPKGWVEARDLRVVFAQAALQPLHDGLARVELAPESATVNLDAKSGGGAIALAAHASLPAEGPPAFTASTKLTRFPVSAGSLVRIDLNAEAKGEVREDATRVQVELTNGFVHVPDEETESLHPITELEDVVYVDRLPGGTGGEAVKTATAAPGPPVLVQVRSVRPLDVRGGPVDAALATALDAESRGGATRITGKAHVTEGAITLFRRRYVIERADLIFEGKDPPDPRVDVRLRHEFDDLSFRVRVRGTAQDPEVEFSSSPARFSKPELLTIFLGTDPADLGQKDERTVEQQAVGALAGLVVGRLQDQLGKNLPIDTLDVELGDTSKGGAGTRLTLGKWITRKLFLAYRYKFQADTNVENDNEALVQYRFLPGWMIEVVLGLTRNDADVMWTKRF